MSVPSDSAERSATRYAVKVWHAALQTVLLGAAIIMVLLFIVALIGLVHIWV